MADDEVVSLSEFRRRKVQRARQEAVVDEGVLDGYSVGWSEDGENVVLTFVAGEYDHTLVLSREDARRLAKRTLVAAERARRARRR